jgi:hypothetical protein
VLKYGVLRVQQSVECQVSRLSNVYQRAARTDWRDGSEDLLRSNRQLRCRTRLLDRYCDLITRIEQDLRFRLMAEQGPVFLQLRDGCRIAHASDRRLAKVSVGGMEVFA